MLKARAVNKFFEANPSCRGGDISKKSYFAFWLMTIEARCGIFINGIYLQAANW